MSSTTNLFSSNAPADESSDNRGEGMGVPRINQEELIDISHTLLRRFRCSSCCLRKHTCILYETHPRNARFFFFILFRPSKMYLFQVWNFFVDVKKAIRFT